MNKFLLSIGSDFSMYFSELFDLDSPADDFFDSLVECLGESPTPESVQAFVKSGVGKPSESLRDVFKIEIEDSNVEQALEICLANHFGR